ncbi:hypothetical protein DICVIV_07201 [Dictyocaulus viviparus]|uniref:Uncharacterized protein n=1 Tax=Dictyocaulus viviparus TaxID=29172 RepID=A0A0D8XWK4_DICVI|nr:hypothetical protein DICVIV_07201 [Dictyocaulus viviparus]
MHEVQLLIKLRETFFTSTFIRNVVRTIFLTKQLLNIVVVFITAIFFQCSSKKKSGYSDIHGGQPQAQPGLPPAAPAVPIKPPPPGQGQMVATFDPNYQTLAGINNDDVFKNKAPAPPRGPIAPINQPGPKVAATFDPNYQTLAGINNDDVFKPKIFVIIFFNA